MNGELTYFLALVISLFCIFINLRMQYKRKEAMRIFGRKCSNVKTCEILKRPLYDKFDAFGCPYYKTCERFSDTYR